MTPIFKAEGFKHGRRSSTPRQWRGILLHWPGGSSGALDTIKYTDREGSGGWYHYVIDERGTYECTDPVHYRGAHAGAPWNDHYIGICIANPITPGATADRRIAARGLSVERIPYNGKEVYSLDPTIAAAVAELCATLCDQFSIPFVFHDSPACDITAPDFRGIACHHNVSARKWDCIPWLPVLREAISRASA